MRCLLEVNFFIMSKFLSLFLLTGTIGLCSPHGDLTASHMLENARYSKYYTASSEQSVSHGSGKDTVSDKAGAGAHKQGDGIGPVYAGDYLASRFAQSNHDWDSANRFIKRLVFNNPNTPDELVQRSMVLAMGNGEHRKAIDIARKIVEDDYKGSHSIAEIFLVIEAVERQDFETARARYDQLSSGSTVEFLGPFLDAWIDAGIRRTNIKDLRHNTVQLYHSILIADFLDDHKDVEAMIDQALSVKDINLYELERVADLYGHVGLKDKAIKVYRRVLKNKPDNVVITNKIEALETNKNMPLFQTVASAEHGVALAFHDIATILSSEGNDESARVFGNVALFLKPDLSETIFLLADISQRHRQFDEAIAYYRSIPKSDEGYLDAQFEIVNIYEETQQSKDAVRLLDDLSKEFEQPEVIIKIGDLYRHQSDFKSALKNYNRAAELMDNTIPDEFWHLHYVRGIAYEQLDQWDKAESELKKAMSLRPNHPYVLNYLGYAWADKGENLDLAREMIQKAVSLRPNDGYITDSLGWVLYRIGHYEEAVVILERAVELLPYDPTINDHLGDAYWQVGRAREARFQWVRAKNHSDDQDQIAAIEKKLKSGLSESETSSLQR